MNIRYLLLTLLIFTSFHAFSQNPSVSDTIELKWEALNKPTQGPNFSQYQQAGNFLFAKRADSLFRSADFGKTWVFNRRGIYYYATLGTKILVVEDTINERNHNSDFIETYGTTKFYISNDFGQTYNIDFSENSYRKFYGRSACLDGVVLPVYTLDSTFFYVKQQSCFTELNRYINYKNWGLNLFGSMSGYIPYDYKSNDFYFRNNYNGYLLFGNTQNIDRPDSIKLKTTFLTNASIGYKDSVFTIYKPNFKFTIIESTTNKGLTWKTDTLPFQFNAVFQDKKTIYIHSNSGIFKSQDAAFKTYKQIFSYRPQGDLLTTFSNSGFSILPSGIYMNGLNNELLRSKDEGDTWQIVNNTEGVIDFTGLINFQDSIWLVNSNRQIINPLDFNSYRQYEHNDGSFFINSVVNAHRIDRDIFFENDNLIFNDSTKKLSELSFRIYAFEDNKIASFYRLQSGKYTIDVSTDKGSTFKNNIFPIETLILTNIGFHKGKLWLKYLDGEKGKNILILTKSDDLTVVYGKIELPITCTTYKIIADTHALTIFTTCGIFESVDTGKTWLQFAEKPTLPYDVVKYKDNYIFSFYEKDYALITNDKGASWSALKKVPQTPLVISGKYMYSLHSNDVNSVDSDKKLYRTPMDSILKHLSIIENYAILSGQIFKDQNNNCLKDTFENSIAEKVVRIEPRNYTAITDKNGRFSIALPPDTYSVTTLNLPYFKTVCSDTILKNIILEAKEKKDTQFVFKKVVEAYDLAISLSTGSRARPGFELDFVVKTQNLGTENIDSALVTLDIPNAYVEFVNVEQGGVMRNNQIVWTLKNQALDDNRIFNTRLRLAPNTPLSTQLIFKANALIFNKKDTFPINNSDSTRLTVTGSFDPNDKTVLPEGKIPFFTKELDYLIRFQNTGTDTAFRVVVIDTLPPQLDIFTLKTVAASHPYSVSIKKNIVTFTFDNILLPDSIANERGSHGFIRFKIMPIKGLKVGENIDNKAAIYFDYNQPIITNTAQLALIKPMIIRERGIILCKGESYRGKPYFSNAIAFDTIQSLLYDTTFMTHIEVKTDYNISKDTVLKANEKFLDKDWSNGDNVIIKLKSVWGCDSVITYKIIKISTATTELPSVFSSLKIYPNPAKDYVSISYELKKATWVEIVLYNLIGQKVKVLQEKTPNTEGVQHDMKSDLKGLKSGWYQIGVRTEQGIYYRRFVLIE